MAPDGAGDSDSVISIGSPVKTEPNRIWEVTMKAKDKKKEVKKPRQDPPVISWAEVFENEDNPSSLDTFDGEL